MSADDTDAATAAAAAAETTPDTTTPAVDSSETTNANGDKKGPNGRRDDRRKDETPIEELFDLSKPIPKADKPDKAAFDKSLAELTEAIDKIKDDRKKVQEQIDDSMSDPAARQELQQARNKSNALKSKKGALIDEKKALRGKLDATRNQSDKIAKEKKDARSNMKFSTLEEIDAELGRLKRRQETTTMKLNEEKRLIKEMDALEKSKRFVADLKSQDAAMDDVKKQRAAITGQLTAKDAEIDAVEAEIKEIMKSIKEMADKETAKRDALQHLFKERDDLKKEMNSKIKDKDQLRDDFRAANNAFYNFKRAVYAQKKMAEEEERRKRQEEYDAWQKKIEEEEAKKIPYEEEQALCEYLASYLERTYLNKGGEEKEEKKTEAVAAVKDDPFAGFKPVNRDEDEYFGGGGGKKGKKKKRVRATKKQDAATGPFTLSVDTFEQFGLLSLNPPTSVDQVEGSVKELRAKKEWYKEQPRGSVKTAVEIRKANEKAAAKLRAQREDPSAAENANKKNPNANKGFELSKDDFAPLGSTASAGGGSVGTSSWGKQQQQPESSAPAAETADEQQEEAEETPPSAAPEGDEAAAAAAPATEAAAAEGS